MKIEHIALWTEDLEKLKDFYIEYFQAESNEIYTNTKKGFQSYFLSFKEGARLELMKRVDIQRHPNRNKEFMGYCHMAISVGSKDKVLNLTKRLKEDGHQILGEPRHTGDGYFESLVTDPDGNRIEITI